MGGLKPIQANLGVQDESLPGGHCLVWLRRIFSMNRVCASLKITLLYIHEYSPKSIAALH